MKLATSNSVDIATAVSSLVAANARLWGRGSHTAPPMPARPDLSILFRAMRWPESRPVRA